MTWNEFKKVVDKKIAELGKDGNVEILYLDLYPYNKKNIGVRLTCDNSDYESINVVGFLED